MSHQCHPLSFTVSHTQGWWPCLIIFNICQAGWHINVPGWHNKTAKQFTEIFVTKCIFHVLQWQPVSERVAVWSLPRESSDERVFPYPTATLHCYLVLMTRLPTEPQGLSLVVGHKTLHAENTDARYRPFSTNLWKMVRSGQNDIFSLHVFQLKKDFKILLTFQDFVTVKKHKVIICRA